MSRACALPRAERSRASGLGSRKRSSPAERLPDPLCAGPSESKGTAGFGPFVLGPGLDCAIVLFVLGVFVYFKMFSFLLNGRINREETGRSSIHWVTP